MRGVMKGGFRETAAKWSGDGLEEALSEKGLS